ncbi:malto-oligosyltrehalose trehalohydrolase [Brevibacterium samyangense]|uniref:Malto-oligosyltrehalose trehalohydrolase n=1 Tax=Brevibacterium samyangense TaxID=366888 RepID=A0ABP5EJP1_9MICO
MTFAVWAPRPSRVRVAWRPVDTAYGVDFVREHYREAPLQESELAGLGFRISEARRGSDGWWHVSAPALDRPTRTVEYGYLLDDAPELLPDPRSLRQPYGPHGPSVMTLSPSPFALTEGTDEHTFTDGTGGEDGWFRYEWEWSGRSWDASPVYEMHIGTFTPEGTFDAAIAKLPHVASLGVGWVELLPVNTIGGLYGWGYDGVNWFAIQESYGGPEGYRRFVDAAHDLGLGVLQDVVYNHLGPSGNYLPLFGPYLHEAASNPWGESVNLDGPDSDEVRDFVLDNLEMFALDYGVDGFRLDAVHAFVDSRALHILEDMRLRMDVVTAVRGYPTHLIAESDANDPRLVSLRADGGYGLTAQWSDDFHHALHVALTGETSGYYADFAAPGALAKSTARGFFHDGTFSSFRGRSHGRPIPEDRVRPYQLVVCSQNHDQVGNRAAGDRLSQSLDPRRLALAATLTLLAPTTPMLWMGEEFAASTPWQFFTDHREDWLQEAIRTGRTEEFSRHGWDPALVPDPQDPETFERSKLDWAEAGEGDAGAEVPGTHTAVLALYRELGRLRAVRPEFRDLEFGDIAVGRGTEGGWLAYTLHGTLGVAVNLTDRPAHVFLAPADVTATITVLLEPHAFAGIGPAPAPAGVGAEAMTVGGDMSPVTSALGDEGIGESGNADTVRTDGGFDEVEDDAPTEFADFAELLPNAQAVLPPLGALVYELTPGGPGNEVPGTTASGVESENGTNVLPLHR